MSQENNQPSLFDLLLGAGPYLIVVVFGGGMGLLLVLGFLARFICMLIAIMNFFGDRLGTSPVVVGYSDEGDCVGLAAMVMVLAAVVAVVRLAIKSKADSGEDPDDEQ